MAKNQNSIEKRRREIEKKFKAEEKRKERQQKKVAGAPGSDDNPREPQRTTGE